MGDEQTGEARERVTVVYCGGCNPHIDRAAVAAALPDDDPDVRPGATVHLSGCPRACASDHQLSDPRSRADGRADDDAGGPGTGPSIVVAGELVDGVPTAAPDLAATVARKIKE